MNLPKHVQWVSRLIASSTSASLDLYIICGYARGDFDLSPFERSLLGDETKVRRLHLKRFAEDRKYESWFDDREQLLPELFLRGQLLCNW